MSAHPSHYAIDRVALGGAADGALAEHLAACPRCAGLIASRRAPGPAPGWLDRLGASSRFPSSRRPARRAAALGSALAACAVLVAVIALRQPDRGAGAGEGLRAKGTPQVVVYLKRDAKVTAWDGRSPVRPGDHLRLGVLAPDYARLSVAAMPPPPAAPSVLYAGPLEENAETLLPLAFRVDESGTEEVVSVVLSVAEIAPAEHLAPPASRPGTWSTRIVIPKEIAP